MSFICFPVRSSIVLVNTFAFILKPSSLAWLLFIWRFYVLWVMRMRLGTTATALRLEQMAGNSYGRAPQEVSVIATGRWGIAMMVSLSNETWLYFSLEETGRNLSWELLGGYGRNSKTQIRECAYQTCVAKTDDFGSLHFVAWDTAVCCTSVSLLLECCNVFLCQLVLVMLYLCRLVASSLHRCQLVSGML